MQLFLPNNVRQIEEKCLQHENIRHPLIVKNLMRLQVFARRQPGSIPNRYVCTSDVAIAVHQKIKQKLALREMRRKTEMLVDWSTKTTNITFLRKRSDARAHSDTNTRWADRPADIC